MVRRTVVCVKRMQPAGQSWIEEGHWGLEVSNATGADEAEPLHLLKVVFLMQYRAQLALDGRGSAKGSVVRQRGGQSQRFSEHWR